MGFSGCAVAAGGRVVGVEDDGVGVVYGAGLVDGSGAGDVDGADDLEPRDGGAHGGHLARFGTAVELDAGDPHLVTEGDDLAGGREVGDEDRGNEGREVADDGHGTYGVEAIVGPCGQADGEADGVDAGAFAGERVFEGGDAGYLDAHGGG